MPSEPTKGRRPLPPKGLQAPGRALWRAVLDDLGEQFELTGRELSVLAMAARQRDEIARVEAALDGDGIVTRGSKGQPRLNGALGELRQMRLACSRLLGELDVPGASEEPAPSGTARSQRARHAANARWMAVEQRRERRRGHGPAS